MVFVTAGYIATAYPEEKDKGSYATILMNMQALGSVIGGLLCLLLFRPQELTRDDGSIVAVHPARGAWEELRSNLLVFTDPVLLMMVPAFLPSEGFLVYSGSVNGKYQHRAFQAAG
jgi:hypothetical protein